MLEPKLGAVRVGQVLLAQDLQSRLALNQLRQHRIGT